MNIRIQSPVMFALVATASAASIDSPKLTSTSPVFWAVGVNPTQQKTIALTFDQKMSPAYTAWLGRSSLPPPDLDINSFMSQDRQTLSINVKLEPGKVYVFGLNEKALPGVGFQNQKGISLPPHFLVFQTAGAPKPEDAPPVLVRSLPSNGAQDIDPARTNAVVLTFDKPMRPQKHGLHLFEKNTEVDLSKARFAYSADGRTFTLYYTFKQSNTYRLELNSVHDIGFATVKRVPLWPVQVSFTTGALR